MPGGVGMDDPAGGIEQKDCAAEAIERITLDLELLPFVTDPLESLRPSGPNATTSGNVLAPSKGPAKRDIEGAVSNQMELQEIKWTEADFAVLRGDPKHLAQALEYLQAKRDFRPPKKHGLIPL